MQENSTQLSAKATKYYSYDRSCDAKCTAVPGILGSISTTIKVHQKDLQQ